MNGKSMLGVMIDCSRNAVMKVSAVKRYIDILARMGYNTVMLYTEDTYEVNNQPYFGHLRGRYSKEEIKELDRYCLDKGIELIPCIQTLAHLNCIFKWWDEYEAIRDCDDILLLENEKTLKLIEDIFSTLAECYTTRNIHIGMDEAYRVGLGKYLAEHGYSDRFDLINRHLHKVCAIADKYGFKPMIWSDMFCKLALGNEDYYEANDFEAIKQKAVLPENISLVYWDYYSKDFDRYDRMLKINKAFDRPVIFAGGAWTWKGFAPDNKFSIDTTIAAIEGCKANGVDDVLITIWGDDGGECSRFGVLPALCYTAELYKGNTDEESIKARFKEIVGMDYDSFMLLDSFYDLGEELKSPPKYLLYNDLFLGTMNHKIKGGENEFFENLYKKLSQVIPTDEYKPMFDTLTLLADVLSIKSELGVKTKQLYLAKDKDELRKLAETDYTLAIWKIENFHSAFLKSWNYENKPHGFEVQDIRLGGLIQRIKTCKSKILDYCEGKVEQIPELDEPENTTDVGSSWGKVVSPGVISQQF